MKSKPIEQNQHQYERLQYYQVQLSKAEKTYQSCNVDVIRAYTQSEIMQIKEDLAWLLLDCGRYEDGLHMYREMSWKHQGEMKYLGIIRALVELGKYSDAKKYLDRCLKRFPESSSLLVAAGNFYHSLRLYNKSYKYFDLASCYAPNDRDIKFNKGCALYGSGYYEEAFPLFQNLVASHPKEDMYLTMMGYCYLNTGYPRDARQYFNKVLEYSDACADLYNGLYWSYKDDGLIEDSSEIARTGIKNFPNDDSALYINMADAYLEKGWGTEAVDILKAGISKFPNDEELKTLLTEIENSEDNPADNDKLSSIEEALKLISLLVLLKRKNLVDKYRR